MRPRSRSPANPLALMISIPSFLYTHFACIETQNRLKNASKTEKIRLEGDPSEAVLSITSNKISTKLTALSLVRPI